MNGRAAGVVVVAGLVLAVALGAWTCGSGGADGDPWDDDRGADSGGWEASERDAAGDQGAVRDAGPDLPPEREENPDLRVPRASNRFVYMSNTVADNVVVIDSVTLAVELVGVGDAPAALEALGTLDAAAVINRGSDSVSLIRTMAIGESVVSEEMVAPDTNALSVSPTGLYGVTWYDVAAAGSAPLPPGLQDVSLLEFDSDAVRVRVVQTTVASRPVEIEWSDDGRTAFVVAKHHVCIVEFETLDESLPRCVGFGMVSTNPEDPWAPMVARRVDEVDVSGDGRLAVLRTDDSERIAVLDLSDDAIVEVVLPAVPSDLDLAGDGTFALAAMRGLGQIARIDLADPAAPEVYVADVRGLLAGQITISPDGTRALIFSSVSREEVPGALTEVLGVLDVADATISPVPLEKEVRAIGITPDGEYAVVIHRKNSGNPDDPALHPVDDIEERIDRSYGFSLVHIRTGRVSLQITPTDPGPFLLYQDAREGIHKAFVTLRDDAARIREVRVADLRTFTVRTTLLGSPPASIGVAPGSRKVFVGQDHATGRITFLDARDGSARTVTGFQINDWIVE
ncbi:MAG: hypothetical protein QME96_06445 [Myxococcota bacterium]|nr:hypothetical protein [Myxococcota bacterium]